MSTKPSIFISHTHADKAIADALTDAIAVLFKQRVDVKYSTSKELDGGVTKGTSWVHWIEEQIRDARAALILLTSNSLQKPWVLWEAGAVEGAALAAPAERERRVIPLTYKLSAHEVPTPFARNQITDGLSRGDMDQLLSQLVDEFQAELTDFKAVEAGRRIADVLEKYLADVQAAMQFAPMTVTEPAVQEWLRRIEELEQAGRFGEVDQLHDWMNVAFGRDQEDRLRPLDPRLHSRLGAMYLQGKRPNEAAREFELARRIAPRDIYVLRNLGKAYLDSGRDKDAGELIRAIEVLDAGAFVRNADNAALKARWYRQDGNLTNARRTLDEALEYNPRSYYLADLAAQVVLDQGDRDEARQSFRKLLTTVDESGEVSVWSRASALTAAVALGEDQRALALMAQLRNLHPTPAQMATIDKSLDDVAQRMDTTSLVQRLRQRAEVEGIGKSVENVTVTAGSPSKV